jgi:hypothetical protein
MLAGHIRSTAALAPKADLGAWSRPARKVCAYGPRVTVSSLSTSLEAADIVDHNLVGPDVSMLWDRA